MAKEFTLQDPGEGIHEAEIREILVSPGDDVNEGDIVLVIETDKAAVEVPSPFSGSVADVPIKIDQVVQVGDVLITFDDGAGAKAKPKEKPEKGEEKRDELGEEEKEEKEEKESRQPEKEKPTKKEKKKDEEWEKAKPKDKESEKPKKDKKEPRRGPVPTSPATRRVAKELGVDLAEVPPSGEDGRVLVDDVRAFAEKGEAAEQKAKRETEREPERGRAAPEKPANLPDFGKWGPVEREPLRSVRRATARRMALSWSQIPHVTHQDLVDITELEVFRRRHQDKIEEQGGKLTLTAFALKAAAAALSRHPRFGASLDWEAQELVLKHYCHIGVALDTDRGLLVPVIRDVDRKSVTELAIELHQLAGRVRDEGASPEELAGGSFTITNVGGLGGTGFTPIINYPQVAILGLARARLQPVAEGTIDDHRIVARLMLPICVAFDHRVADGAQAARFTGDITSALTDPEQFALMV